jgi:hypothetical protein
MFNSNNEGRRRRLTIGIASAVLAVGLAAGVAAPANAYGVHSGWGYGSVDVPTAYAVGKTQITTGNMAVYRNGAMLNQQQPVTVNAELLIYTNTGWAKAGGMTKTVRIGHYDRYAWVGGFTLVPGGYGYAATQAGYYSIKYTVTWAAGIDGITGNAIGTSGQVVIYSQHNGDIKCNIARCSPTAGVVALY